MVSLGYILYQKMTGTPRFKHGLILCYIRKVEAMFEAGFLFCFSKKNQNKSNVLVDLSGKIW